MFSEYEFEPCYTPVEMVHQQIFGGKYFNEPFFNGLDTQLWKQFVPYQFVMDLSKEDIDIESHLLRDEYNIRFNKFEVVCGMDYLYWIEREWIKDYDPYGWFNWYINFYYGRRCEDDYRQIKRWKSFKARHGGMLLSNPHRPNLKTKQNLLHWAINYNNL